MAYDFESSATIVILSALIAVYLYILLSPSQPHPLGHKRNFVIPDDTLEGFKNFIKGSDGEKWKFVDDHSNNNNNTKSEWGNAHDDFFLFEEGFQSNSLGETMQDRPTEPTVPSDNFHCGNDWILIRSQLNYKFLWMHTGNMWMAAGATIDTPLHHKSFKLSPVEGNCEGGGWVVLQEGDSSGFIYMVPPNAAAEGYGTDEWVVKMGTSDLTKARNDTAYHFLIENEGFLLNRRSMAFVNVLASAEYVVRGHSSGWDPKLPAVREYGATMQFEYVNASLVEAAMRKEAAEEKEAAEQDQKMIAQIAALPTSTEKRVISFGLYGANPKYTTGAIKNIEAGKIYFPGWVCRFYVTSDVPESVVSKLKSMGAEIEPIPAGKGYISGMFWRFMVASDSTVDRYIIRDSDSRLNARDRLAVEDWIDSKYAVHIMRDHVNHCLVMNGGMWGGIRDAIPNMREQIEAWEKRDEYAADLNFLEQEIWPGIRDNQISHDSYCCDRFPNARPFPSKRPMTYQHVGQVFDAEDHARLNDIDGFIRGVPVPGSCRKHADWIYG